MDNKKDEILKRRSKLSPMQREILEKRLRGEVNCHSRLEIIPKRSQTSPTPLSFAQQRLWFLHQLEPSSPHYSELACLRLTGALKIDALEQSLNDIVQRHEALRTTFEIVEEQAVQVIHPTITVALPVVELHLMSEAVRQAQIEQLTTEIAQKPFDLASGPLLRAMLLQTGVQEHVLLFAIHHIAVDGWSIGVLIRELVALYEAKSCEKTFPLPELPIQYADYAIWQRQWMQGELQKTQLSYWKQQLAGASTLALPTDRPRPPVQSFRGAVTCFKLSPTLTNTLRSLSNREGVTLFMTLLAAFQTLLYRYTGQEDICVGSPIANRNQTEIQGLIGFFVNTLVLRTHLSGNPSFLELLGRVREVCIGAYANADIPLEQLVEELHPERNLNQTPLFQVMFGLLEDTQKDLTLPGLTLSWLPIHTQTARFDLTLQVVDGESELRGSLEYNTDLFNAETITRMVEHFRTMLSGIVTNPQARLSDLPVLTAAQLHQQVVEWNDTSTNYPTDVCIHQLFEAQVERTPDALAVVYEDQQLTYCELNARANQLAHYLRKLGVGPEVLVGICVERSLSMIIGLLGILKAGGAYVPLDPTYPQERLAFILEDAQVPVLLTQQQLVEVMPQHKAKIICLDTDWQTIVQQSQENLFREIATNNLAYVIYTSGSTGKPKGVQIPHSALSNFLHAMRQTPGLSAQDTLLAVTTYSFDIAALELFLPIIVGARLVVVSREIASDGAQLSTKLTDSNATVMQATPATWQLLLAAGWGGNHQLKILCGGEALPGQLANQLLKRCDSLWNMYGPTETTIWSAACLVEKDSSIVPISHPIANTQFYILDQYRQLVPVGVRGELHIGGNGLARGYLNRPELTAEKFIPNPFSEQLATRLYKTGDLARYSPSGEIEYLGRIDHQVKVRGFRIELGEIEAHLRQHPKVRETVVVVRSDSVDSQRIVAYVVPHSGQTLTITELRDFLESKLPNYMVPAAFVMLEALPLTPNGKIDRHALPTPDKARPDSEAAVAARNPFEELLTGIWKQIFGVEQVGIHDNFFELGGHSLLATQVMSRVRDTLQLEVPLRYLFEAPTIAGLAKSIETARLTKQGLQAPPVERVSRDRNLPLSFAQQRLWFLHQLDPNSTAYNGSSAVLLQGALNVAALEKSINEIVRRHEVLRTCFAVVEEQAVQRISSELMMPLSIVDLQNLLQNERETEVRRLGRTDAQQPFDLTQAPLMRLTLLRLGTEEHILLVTMHHIISDGWSAGVFIHEISALYEAFATGKPSLRHATLTPLPELSIQYVDFAVWQRQWLQGEILDTQLSYWKKQLEGAKTVLELPTDRPRSTLQTSKGTKHAFALSPTLSGSLKSLSQQQGVTLFMTLLAAFNTLLYCYTRQEDILIGTPIANRNRPEIEGLIGFFVNTLVLRTDLSNNPSFIELLQRVREVTLGAYTHQDLPFEKLVAELQLERNFNHTPLFQVWFVLQNAPMSALELSGLKLSFLEVQSSMVRHDLKLDLSETPKGLKGFFEYKIDLFNATTIAQMVGLFEILLATVVEQPDIKLTNLVEILKEVEKQQQIIKNQELKQERSHQLGQVKRQAITGIEK
ncbi:non-ribosomal peptide synthetase [Scytonema tolypothrichoides VB-61278]|nr:non-ribosomal peptide synthetase [Scytonema tolypothrichoides VB-61278]